MNRMLKNICVVTTLIIMSLVAWAAAWGAGKAVAPPATRPSTAPVEKEVSMLFVGSSFLVGGGSQAEILPAMLQTKNWKVNVGKCSSSGMGCVYAYAHNQGRMAASEKQRLAQGKLKQEDWDKTCGGRKGMLTKAINSNPAWDYLILDTYGSIGEPDFEEALVGIITEVRAHSPKCRIILYCVWGKPNRSEEERRAPTKICYGLAKKYNLWAAPCGLALMDGYNQHPDYTFYKTSEVDAKGDPNFFHEGYDGAYICSAVLFAMVTDTSPVGLPFILKVHPTYDFPTLDIQPRPDANSLIDFVLNARVARYLQELAWKTYQAELAEAKP